MRAFDDDAFDDGLRRRFLTRAFDEGASDEGFRRRRCRACWVFWTGAQNPRGWAALFRQRNFSRSFKIS